ncbi:MAG: response regulator [Rhizobiales bacterium]|nr:response regulator [Hyphomicrobiales bacterium]
MILLRGVMRASEALFGSEGHRPRPPLNDPSDDGATDQRRLRVMIVEDELFVAMHLESVLEEIGYEVTGIVSSGESALEEFSLQKPDFVLMDINLGVGINGIAAAQQIRSTGDVEIIFVSAYSDAATRTRVEAALPGSRILSKPVTPSGLKSAIEAHALKRQ